MKKLYDGVQRFCAAHPRFGIPNLMRVIVIGNVAVYVLMLLTQANDANTARAAGYAVAALHAGYRKLWEHWEFNAFARVDNLFDHAHVGSVIVNEGNGRFYEPAPGRGWLLGLRWNWSTREDG